MKKLIILIFCLNVFGCSSTSTVNVPAIKQELKLNSLTINDEVLSKYSSYVVLDELEGHVYYAGSDWNNWLLGNAYSKIYFTYHPETKIFFAEFRSFSTEWIHSKWLSVYIGKDKIINKSAGIIRRTSISQIPDGNGADSVYTHEWYKFKLTLDEAEKLANAKPASITLRFGGSDAGYIDQKIVGNSDSIGLKAVVELTKATTGL